MQSKIQNVVNGNSVNNKTESERRKQISVNKSTEKSPTTKENAWACDLCSSSLNNESDKLLTCEYCSNHRCLKCLGMSNEVFKAINGRQDLPWFCSSCIGKSLNVLRETKSIEDRCSDFLSEFEKKVEEKMKTIEIDVKHIKESMSAMKEEIINAVKDQSVPDRPPIQNESTSISDQATTNVNTGDNEQILDSIQDRMNRKNNVVFYNVAEGKGNLKDEKVKHDKSEIKSIATEVGVQLADDDIISVRRLGKTGIMKKVHGKEVEVPRVLLVGFSETVKATIMKNAYKLQFSKSDYIKKSRN